MINVPTLSGAGIAGRLFLFLCLMAFSSTVMAALPRRLVLLVDGISYRDMQALQQGVTYQDLRGRKFYRQAFNEGYFPVSRNVSTFPSASDVAWTEILGNQPVPGYQRTYFNVTSNATVSINGVTSSMEFERQMDWQLQSGYRRVMSYVAPVSTFKYEVKELAEQFLKTKVTNDTYYVMIHSTDSAQHLSGDVFAMLAALDQKLQELRARYRALEGRELEILIISDHGNNHAGAGKRVAIKGFLNKAGYRITKSIRGPKDIVLPTAGIESWVEIHNVASETERLVQLLPQLPGADLVTAQSPDKTNRFIVVNAQNERATIEWNRERNLFRYAPESGDPLGYCAVAAALSQKNLLDSDGFATADAWMAETLTHHYPLALERIVRGHTQVTRNPATILISLSNDYVHCGWFIRRGAALVKSGGTHGALDALNSNGILLSSFAPTQDTSTSRVATRFGGFKELHGQRPVETIAGSGAGTDTSKRIAQRR